jgi:hypothetical protein
LNHRLIVPRILEPISTVSEFDERTKAFPALVGRAQKADKSASTSDICKPIFEVGITIVIIATTQFQLGNIFISTYDIPINVILRVVAKIAA